MALQRPTLVPRLALINSLATYRDQWRKWMHARSNAALIRLFGMRGAARIFAAGLFPEPWQTTFRDRAPAVVAAVPARSYLSMSRALEQCEAAGRLDRKGRPARISRDAGARTGVAGQCGGYLGEARDNSYLQVAPVYAGEPLT
jgi:hypothetical protein